MQSAPDPECPRGQSHHGPTRLHHGSPHPAGDRATRGMRVHSRASHAPLGNPLRAGCLADVLDRLATPLTWARHSGLNDRDAAPYASVGAVESLCRAPRITAGGVLAGSARFPAGRSSGARHNMPPLQYRSMSREHARARQPNRSLEIDLPRWRLPAERGRLHRRIGDYAAQAAKAAENMRLALADCGAALHDVVYTRVIVATTRRENLVEAWRAVRDTFGDHDSPSTCSASPSPAISTGWWKTKQSLP